MSALADLIRTYGVDDIAAVTGYTESSVTKWQGMSCEYTDVTVEIDYRTSAGVADSFTYRGDFGALIRSLTD